MPKERIFERSIAEGENLTRGKIDEIERKEQNINNELFREYFNDYQSPSGMFTKLSETEGAAVNEVQVDLIKKILTKMKKSIENVPKKDEFKIKENKRI